MVARSGTHWNLAPCLTVMVDEADTLAPERLRKADGSIGDAAHASRRSHHNPYRGWVDALDLTHAPSHGWDCQDRIETIVARRDPRVEYLIFARTIWRGYDKPNVPAWQPSAYAGSNPHTHHMHVSVWRDERRMNQRPWWPEEDPMSVDPRGTVRLVMREWLGRSPETYDELDWHVERLDALGLNGYIEWLEAAPEAKAWAARIGAEVRRPDRDT